MTKWNDELLETAWREAFSSPAGARLVASLQAVMLELPPSSEASALQEHNGRRKFAAQLMALAGDVKAAHVPAPAPAKKPPGRLPGRRIGPEDGT